MGNLPKFSDQNILSFKILTLNHQVPIISAGFDTNIFENFILNKFKNK